MAVFLRITFTSFDLGNLPHTRDVPFCAVKIKDSVLTDQGWTLAQHRRTMYPPWHQSLDTHVMEGRVLQVALMRSVEETLAKGTVDVKVLAKHCISHKGNTEYWVDLLPSGTVLLRVKIFTEQEVEGDSQDPR